MASLMRDSTRPWLEEVAFGLLGRKISFNMAVDATLPDPVFSEMAFGVAEPEPVATPAKAVQVAPVPAPEDAAAAKSASEEAFYQDPLIKRAVERFKLTLIDNPQS